MKKDTGNGTLELSEEQVQAMFEENRQLKAEAREATTKQRVKELEEKGFPAVVLNFAAEVMAADEGEEVLQLSEGRSVKSYTATDIVEGILSRVPEGSFVNLSEDKVTEKDTTKGTEPDATTESENAEFSDQERIYRSRVHLFGRDRTVKAMGLSEEKAEEIEKSIEKKLGLAEPATA